MMHELLNYLTNTKPRHKFTMLQQLINQRIKLDLQIIIAHQNNNHTDFNYRYNEAASAEHSQ